MPKVTLFCSKVIMIKTFNPVKSRRPWLLIVISHLSQQGLLSSQPVYFYTRCVLGLDLIKALLN